MHREVRAWGRVARIGIGAIAVGCCIVGCGYCGMILLTGGY